MFLTSTVFIKTFSHKIVSSTGAKPETRFGRRAISYDASSGLDGTVKKAKPVPWVVAIVGGSGSGKTWLADSLRAALGRRAARMSLDDFYRDRSHLSAARRAQINYDHPRAIDWQRLEQILADFRAGRRACVPQYDFENHSRRLTTKILRPAPVLLLDGLWLLRRPRLRCAFDLSIFIECPAKARLARRLDRDSRSRGRTRASVRRQFLETVEPMHRRYVLPQSRLAAIRLRSPINRQELGRIASILRAGPTRRPRKRV